jgi:hypothetical protein
MAILNPNAFYGEGGLRYPDKSLNSEERNNFYVWYDEQISIYGQKVDYYVNSYSLTGHDFIYGEQPSAVFKQPVKVIMMLELTEDSVFLGKFGLQSDDNLTAYVTISSFYSSFGAGSEPKSGDVFKLTEYGDSRPGDRDGKLFEITERLDQDNSTINPLMGHYVWQIKARRVDFTFRPGLTGEKGSDQVHDDTFAGRLSGYTNDESDAKKYSDNVDAAGKDVFDYNVLDVDDDVYGDYF